MGTISLSEALNAAPRTRPLRVATILEHELDKADAATLRAALDDLHVPATRIERALSQLGVGCSGNAITKWREVHGVGKAT